MGEEDVEVCLSGRNFCVVPGAIQNVKETKDQTECKVTGDIPSWLRGDIIRNGPAEYTAGDEAFTHWFDGHAMLTKFSIKEGNKVFFQSKFIDSLVRKDHVKHQKLNNGGLGTKCIQDPCFSIFKKFMTMFWYEGKKDNTNVSITQLADKAYATGDAASTWKFNPETLESECNFRMTEKFLMPLATAHPQIDMNGDFINVGLMPGKETKYAVLKIPRETLLTSPDPIREAEVFASVPVTDRWKPGYTHSFHLTENYIIIHEQTLKLDIMKILHPLNWKNPFGENFCIDDGFQFRFHVVNKHTGEVLDTKYCTKERMCFHTINAYEESKDGKNYLILDTCISDKTYHMFELIKFANMLRDASAIEKMELYPQRFILPLDVNETTPLGTNLIDLPNTSATASLREDGMVEVQPQCLINKSIFDIAYAVDLPRHNLNYNGKKYKYAYLTIAQEFLPCGILKLDVDSGEYITWMEKDHFASEPVFIPNPNGTKEDDGVVLSTILSNNPKKNPPFLLVLDGSTFTEIARAETNRPLNLHIHASFFPKSS